MATQKISKEADFDVSTLKFCVYYNAESKEIIDMLPKDMPSQFRSAIIQFWGEIIPQEILIALSTYGEMTATQLREKIGHSSSTLHENIKRLEDAGLIETQMSYIGNKQRILKPKILFVSKNPRFKTMFQKFFQGLFVDSDKTKKILAVLDKEPTKYFTAEEISLKTGIPADEIELLLSNWDSQITRSLSDFLKKKPFEKKVLYRSIKQAKKK